MLQSAILIKSAIFNGFDLTTSTFQVVHKVVREKNIIQINDLITMELTAQLIASICIQFDLTICSLLFLGLRASLHNFFFVVIIA